MQVVHLPGLLHTEDYARAIFGAVLPAMPRLEVELRVAHRMQRQQVFERSKPLPYVGFIHEAALRMQFGGRKVTRDQLNYLLAVSDRPDLVLRVLPVERGAFPGSGSAVLYAEGAVPQLDTVQLDSTDGPGFVHAESLLSKYREHLDWMDAESLSPEQSRDFIRRVSHDL
ncbi:DNA-binding protein [Streptomyces albireticuli]|uniref:DNA-binding protein n=2 Tax=Streptomyces albireticuli TaxID=1940 RepID=A0A1Z2L7L8_9ACTN|nr:DNA-binding protein [Streptomyces albireticuli]